MGQRKVRFDSLLFHFASIAATRSYQNVATATAQSSGPAAPFVTGPREAQEAGPHRAQLRRAPRQAPPTSLVGAVRPGIRAIITAGTPGGSGSTCSGCVMSATWIRRIATEARRAPSAGDYRRDAGRVRASRAAARRQSLLKDLWRDAGVIWLVPCWRI